MSIRSLEANLVASLVRPLVVPTMVADVEATDAARIAAARAVEPRFVTVSENQVIVEAGQVIDSATREILEYLGLIEELTGHDDTPGVGLVQLPPGRNPTSYAPAPEVGRAAPDFILPATNGELVRLVLSDLRARME
ncbi:MAG: hypothetical protein IIC91_15480 [Chloroflexi bacterium]|nr:hypothetical protein [Chloroflexota bacterium]